MTVAPGRRAERGGLAILLTLLILAFLAGGALATAGNVLRESALATPGVPAAQAFAAADSGLDWVAAGVRAGDPAVVGPLARVLADPGGPGECPLPAEGEISLGPVGEAGPRAGFTVQARYLGLLDRSPGGAPDPVSERVATQMALQPLWEFTAHGRCRVGPPGTAQQVYHQICQGWATLALANPPSPGNRNGGDPDPPAPVPPAPPSFCWLGWNILR